MAGPSQESASAHPGSSPASRFCSQGNCQLPEVLFIIGQVDISHKTMLGGDWVVWLKHASSLTLWVH